MFSPAVSLELYNKELQEELFTYTKTGIDNFKFCKKIM